MPLRLPTSHSKNNGVIRSSREIKGGGIDTTSATSRLFRGREKFWIGIPVALILILQLSESMRMMLDSSIHTMPMFLEPNDLRSRREIRSDEFYTQDNMKPFCQQWSASDALNHTLQPFDKWYTHHPNWIVTNETDDMFCLEPADTQTYPISNMMKFYANQFHSQCNILHKRTMWGSGWSASLWHIQAGLIQGLNNHVPLFMDGFQSEPWIYTANKDDWSNLTCDAGDTTCYFLPYHGCESKWNISTYVSTITLDDDVKVLEVEDNYDNAGIADVWGWSAYLFITRKQLWLRRAVFDYKEHFRQLNAIGVGSLDCTVIHVRRGDSAVERTIYPVADYVEMIPKEILDNPNHYILLLTDDSNAIDEAHEFYPDLKWVYSDKPRFNGASGGWQHFTPSRNPAYEVTALLAELELATECSILVHGPSGYSNFMHQHVSTSWFVVV